MGKLLSKTKMKKIKEMFLQKLLRFFPKRLEFLFFFTLK